MTSWQDQQGRGGAERIGNDSGTDQPMSRRAAREAERRAAEAVQERQPHPSGVVDFEAHDFSAEFAPDQDFNVGDTQDIWAALTRADDRLGAQEATQHPSGPSQPGDSASVSGELLDRVRDAVLRRAVEQQAPLHGTGPQQQAPRTPTAPQPQAPQAFQPATKADDALPPAVVVPQRARPAQPVPPSDAGLGATRRERRQREQAVAREDELPTDLFVDRGPVTAPPVSAAPIRAVPSSAVPASAVPVSVFPGAVADEDEDDYFSDEPYAPEPTAVIPSLRAMELEVPPSTPSALPPAFAEPLGDDAITFSSPVRVVPAEPLPDRPAAAADASFVAPPPEAWDLPASAPAAPRSVPVSPFLPPQSSSSRFAEPELGPPSEVTDLAGFEALIRKARQQPAPAAQPDQGRALAWADDEEEVQEGFTGLLGRSVQGSHGSSGALILPNDPQPVDVTQAVSGTGDIFVTGSMNLSRSLSTTGATSDYDSHEIDRMFDAAQDEPATGVAPVRASRAVSGTDQHRAIVSGRKSHGTLLPTVLAVVAGALAVGVVALLIGSRLSGIF